MTYEYRHKIPSTIQSRLSLEHIKRIIYHNQVRCIPGKQGWFNIRKPMNVIHHMNRINDEKKTDDDLNRHTQKASDKILYIFIKKHSAN